MYQTKWWHSAQKSALNSKAARLRARDLQPQPQHPRSATESHTTNDSMTSPDHMASPSGQKMRGLRAESDQATTGVEGAQLAPPNVCPTKYNELRQQLHDAKGTPAHAELAQQYYSLLANA